MVNDRLVRSAWLIACIGFIITCLTSCSKPYPPGTNEPRVQLFVCGCEPCAYIGQRLQNPQNFDYYYSGNQADAEEYRSLHGVMVKVTADPDGSLKTKYRVASCPSLVFETGQVTAHADDPKEFWQALGLQPYEELGQ